MKRKSLFPLLTTFVLIASFATAQTTSTKELSAYYSKAGITKKISELPALTQKKQPDSAIIKRLQSIHKVYQDMMYKKNSTGLAASHGESDKVNNSINSTSSGNAASSNVAQLIRSNFLAIDYYESTPLWPPDPGGAVSATQVVVSTNNGIAVFDKPGATDSPILTPTGYSNQLASAQLFLPLDRFFSPVSTSISYLTDVHTRYDRLTKHWFMVCIDAASNNVLLAVSNGEKIADSSSFTYYSFNSSLLPYNPSDPVPPFLDYPTLGVDANSVLIGGNQLTINNQFYFDSIKCVGYVLDKRMLLHGNLAVKPFLLGGGSITTNQGSGLYTPQGVQNDDPEAKESFFAGTSFTIFNLQPPPPSYDHDTLVIAKIRYDILHRSHLAPEIYVPVKHYSFPRPNSSPGGLSDIDQNNTRLLAAEIHKNKLTGKSSLWTAHAVGVDQSGDFTGFLYNDSAFVQKARSAARWYEIGNIYSTPVLSQLGTVYDASEPSGRRAVQYFNPSIAASGQGHAVIGGTTDAYNQYLNVFVSDRYNNNPKGATSEAVKATNTTAMYAPYYSINRWGDFSQTVVDPEDDQTIWTFQEYAAVDDDYGVRVVQVKAPAPAVPLPVGPLSNDRDTVIALQGVDVDNRAFFDPGDEMHGPGYNRLKVKSTGDITVSNIKFISPTKISFKLHTKGQQSGSYTLKVINPDGQSVTTDYIINATSTTINNNSQLIGVSNKMAATVTTSALMPNPTSGQAKLQLTSVSDFVGKLLVLDLNGKVIQQYTNQFIKGTNNVTLQLADLSSGSYIVAVYDGNNVPVAVHKVVKQ